jgi:hypothetical protein
MLPGPEAKNGNLGAPRKILKKGENDAYRRGK